MRISIVQNLLLSVLLGCGMLLASIIPTAAQTSELDGVQLRALMLLGIWDAEHEEYGYWHWNNDGTVCLTVGSMTGDCADSGNWEINGNVLCYELGWWGDSVGERENCFTVQDLGEGRYETLFHGGAMVSRMFAFEVLT